MRKRVYIAFVLLIIGLLNILDWYIFWHENSILASQNFYDLKLKYVERFPDWFRPMIELNPQPLAILLAIVLTLAGVIFILEKKIIYIVLGVLSFLIVFQNLFSIM